MTFFDKLRAFFQNVNKTVAAQPGGPAAIEDYDAAITAMEAKVELLANNAFNAGLIFLPDGPELAPYAQAIGQAIIQKYGAYLKIPAPAAAAPAPGGAAT
ncbi:MAG TPA: hypothetical protein VG248_17145 [Caulobacteraceae bacterium]|jgi:hypothetical protein|nr:hypothetical protein [Caulobacteraceae bacterium]